MDKYLNVEGVCAMLGVSRKTFYKNHRKEMDHPRILEGRRGYWWVTGEVRRYGKAYGLIK